MNLSKGDLTTVRRLLIASCFLLSGCAGLRKSETQSGHIEQSRSETQGFLGFKSEIANSQMRVVKVVDKSPAEKAGLEIGDTIEAFNGEKLSTRQDRLDFWKFIKSSPSQRLKLTVRRGDESIILNPILAEIEIDEHATDLDFVDSLIFAGDNVSIAVVVDKIDCPDCYTVGFNVEEWKEGIRTYTLNEFEAAYLYQFGSHKNFRLVDRNKVDVILSEIHFQTTGAVHTDETEKIGHFASATHIEFLSFFRGERFGSNVDILSTRLVDVNSGEVLASQKIESDPFPLEDSAEKKTHAGFEAKESQREPNEEPKEDPEKSGNQKTISRFYLDYAVVKHTLKNDNDSGVFKQLMALYDSNPQAANFIADFWWSKVKDACRASWIETAEIYSRKVTPSTTEAEKKATQKAALDESDQCTYGFYYDHWDEINRMIQDRIASLSRNDSNP